MLLETKERFAIPVINRKGEVICYSPVDEKDYHEQSIHTWRTNKRGYVYRMFWDGEKNHCIYLHREIMNAPKGLDVDHRNGDKRDNRKSTNLRLATRSQNIANSKVRSSNTSGVTGVTWNRANQVWVAYITINCKHIYLGSFEAFAGAVAARNAAVKALQPRFGRISKRKTPAPTATKPYMEMEHAA